MGEFWVPERLREQVAGFHSGMGLGWLSRLPGLVAECRERWGLTLGEPFTYPSLSYVAPGVRPDGSELVLKLGFLYDELACEVAALRWYAGRGAVRLLEAEPERGILLLESLKPGTCLAEHPDPEEATSIAARAMRELWRPAPEEHAFPTVAGWLSGLEKLRPLFGGTTGPFPTALVERAEGLAAELLASAPAPALLHGDLQHFNVLRAQRAPWLVIDPKGVVGDPGYEVGAFMCNEWDQAPDVLRFQSRRLDQFSEELGIDRARLSAWAFVHAVLSAWWTVEDQGSLHPDTLRHVQTMAALAA